MPLPRLSTYARERLERILQRGEDAVCVRHADAILRFYEGESQTEIAHRLGITRRTVYNWISNFNVGRRRFHNRLGAKPRPGRPSIQTKLVKHVAKIVRQHKPDYYGYLASNWTARLIRRHIEVSRGIDVSLITVRRALRALRLRHKRPRYTLSRTSPTWRQAKGGSNAAFPAEIARSYSS